MNVKELRGGNIIKHIYSDKDYSEVIGYDYEYVYLNEVTFDYVNHSDIEPILLTEEWLLKFGFETRVTSGHSVQYFIGINPITRDWLFDILWLEGYKYPFYRNGHFEIQYLHQLQNLYFALTNEELTYDL